MKEFESLAASIEEDRSVCRVHPSRPGAKRCVDCGGTFCSECGFDWEGDFICRSCVRSYRVEGPPRPDAASPDKPPEYADPCRTFSPRTVLRILMSPGPFFARMPRGRGLSEMIVFAFFWGMVLFALSIPSFYVTVYTVFKYRPLREAYESAWAEIQGGRKSVGAIPSGGEITDGSREEARTVPPSGVPGRGETVGANRFGWAEIRSTLVLILSFPMGVIPIFVLMALLQHGMLTLMGYPSRFETTARIGLFASVGIAAAIPPIPIVAIFFGFVIYPIALTAIGLRQVYGTGVFKATFLAIISLILANQLMLQLTGLLRGGS